MTENRTSCYEGLFLFPQSQTADLQAAADLLRAVLDKAGAELIALQKWDERRLAYEIGGNKRGVYFLAYFSAPREAFRGIERSCNLSELILRFLIVRADHLTREQMEAADRTAELADEIKLRAERALTEEGKAEGEGDNEEDMDSMEAVTVETEPVAKDAAGATDA